MTKQRTLPLPRPTARKPRPAVERATGPKDERTRDALRAVRQAAETDADATSLALACGAIAAKFGLDYAEALELSEYGKAWRETVQARQ